MFEEKHEKYRKIIIRKIIIRWEIKQSNKCALKLAVQGYNDKGH